MYRYVISITSNQENHVVKIFIIQTRFLYSVSINKEIQKRSLYLQYKITVHYTHTQNTIECLYDFL